MFFIHELFLQLLDQFNAELVCSEETGNHSQNYKQFIKFYCSNLKHLYQLIINPANYCGFNQFSFLEHLNQTTKNLPYRTRINSKNANNETPNFKWTMHKDCFTLIERTLVVFVSFFAISFQPCSAVFDSGN